MREEKERLLEANRAYEQRLEANKAYQERLEAGPEEKADLDSIPVRDVSLRYDIKGTWQRDELFFDIFIKDPNRTRKEFKSDSPTLCEKGRGNSVSRFQRRVAAEKKSSFFSSWVKIL